MVEIDYRRAYKRLVLLTWRLERDKPAALSHQLARLRSTNDVAIRLGIVQLFLDKYYTGEVVVVGDNFKSQAPRATRKKPAGAPGSSGDIKRVKETVKSVKCHTSSPTGCTSPPTKRKCVPSQPKSLPAVADSAESAPKVDIGSQPLLKRPVCQKRGKTLKAPMAASREPLALQLSSRLHEKTHPADSVWKCCLEDVKHVEIESELPKSYWKLAGVDANRFDFRAYGPTSETRKCRWQSLKGAPEGLDINVVLQPIRDNGPVRMLRNLSRN
jgi:hypothetical protein